jgi:tRNA threonylcarbamoyladenosine biosynthesis protein TsaB
MRILALDAATEACSAALLDGTALTERFEVIGRGHANRLLPMVDALLREAGRPLREIDAVAFGRGPGGFTGLRIAAGIAQGLAAGAGKPVLPVSNLAAIAAGAARTHGPALVVACLDARMNQVYWAAFDTGAMPPRPLTPESLAWATGSSAWTGRPCRARATSPGSVPRNWRPARGFPRHGACRFTCATTSCTGAERTDVIIPQQWGVSLIACAWPTRVYSSSRMSSRSAT